MFAGLGLGAACAHELFGFKVRLVGAEVASTGLQLCEKSQLAAGEGSMEVGEGVAGVRRGDGAELGAHG